jgi:hypothetical protein
VSHDRTSGFRQPLLHFDGNGGTHRILRAVNRRHAQDGTTYSRLLASFSNDQA